MKTFTWDKSKRQMPRGLRARVIRRWVSPSHGARLRHEWQKGLTAFRRPFKPPQRGPTPDRKRRPAATNRHTGKPAGRPVDRVSVDVIRVPRDLRVPARANAHAPSILSAARKEHNARRNSLGAKKRVQSGVISIEASTWDWYAHTNE